MIRSLPASLILLPLWPLQEIPADIAYERRPEGEWKTVSQLTLRSGGRLLGQETGAGWRGLPYLRYTIDPGLLGSRGLMAAAKPGRWSYLILREETLLCSVELATDLRSIVMVQPDTGITADFWKAIQEAGSVKGVADHHYFVRYLGSSGILFAALWLHSDADDLVIPIGDTFGRWTAYKAYTPGEIEGLLKSEMRKLRSMNDHGSPPEGRPPSSGN